MFIDVPAAAVDHSPGMLEILAVFLVAVRLAFGRRTDVMLENPAL